MLDFLEIAGTSFSMIQILFLFMNWNHFFVYGLEPIYVDELEPFFVYGLEPIYVDELEPFFCL